MSVWIFFLALAYTNILFYCFICFVFLFLVSSQWDINFKQVRFMFVLSLALVPPIVIPIAGVQRKTLTGWLWLTDWMNIKEGYEDNLFHIYCPFLQIILHTLSGSVQKRSIHLPVISHSPQNTHGDLYQTPLLLWWQTLQRFYYTWNIFRLKLYYYLFSCDLARDNKHHDGQSPG